MMQNMQKKIAAEGAKREKMFDQYMCYCQNADGTLGKSISDAETKIPQVESAIKEGAASKKQLKADLKQAKQDRVEAKDAIAEATAIRAKEAKAYSKVKNDAEANIGALAKAIPAIEKGMGGAFLQTSAGAVLRQISVAADMNSADREILASFLSDKYAPASGEIVGILKTMHDEMTKDYADATADETTSNASSDSLIASKNKEIEALTKAVESKTKRIGELGVKLAEMENDLEDTQEGLAEDTKFLADLDTNCALKKKEWDEYKKMEAMEMVALADTIKILNDDDVLELLKKTLPSAGSSFLQVQVSSRSMRQHAMNVLRTSAHKADHRLDLIALAMHGGKIGFEKIITMIDNLVVDLKAEQGVDEDKKAYCLAEFDKAEDKKKGLDLDISDLGKAIDDAKESLSTLISEIKALGDGIKKLDASVAEATATRKEEHDEFVSTLAANTAAKDVLAFAKNRLQKFYNPKLYKAPAKRELSEAEQITVNNGGTLAPTDAPVGVIAQAQALAQTGAAPPPAPEANLAYKKSGEAGGGVIAMIDLLVADIDKENQIMEVDEKDAQKDYESFMSDASAKRAQDSKSITDKESAKAETESELQTNTDDKKSKTVEAMETAKYIGGLHEECDWLLSNFDARKSARSGEVDALGKAKAVLSGADYSLVQVSSVHLRGAR